MKYYVHPGARVKDTRIFCSECGAYLGEVSEKTNFDDILKTAFPCTISCPVPFDADVRISVWNCQASVYYGDIDLESLPLTEGERQRLDQLVARSIWDVGGSITLSGEYPPSDTLVDYVKKLIKKYKGKKRR